MLGAMRTSPVAGRVDRFSEKICPAEVGCETMLLVN